MDRCPTPAESNRLFLALCRSLVHEALALAFRPPAAGARALDPGTPPAVVLADAAAGIDARCGTALAVLAAALVARPEWAAAAARAGLYERLFGHTARGPIPPYETEYGADTLFQKPQDLSDVAAFVRAFGLALDPQSHERIDHLSCELEFLAFLLRKEAHALQTRDGAMLGATVEAERLFLRDHLGRMTPAFARRLLAADPDGPYGAAAALLLEFARSEADRLGVPLGPESLPLRTPLDDGAPTACGAGACAPDACGSESGD
jgi:TorA maturation chaperone TorD